MSFVENAIISWNEASYKDTSKQLPEQDKDISLFEVFWLQVSFPKSKRTGPGCSKLTTLVNISLKFQMLIFEIQQNFLLKKCENLLSFFQQKISVYLVIKL